MDLILDPTADIATPWTTAAPHWSKIDEGATPDLVTIHADDGDSGEMEAFAFGGFNSGFQTVTKVVSHINGRVNPDTTDDPYVAVYINGVSYNQAGISLTTLATWYNLNTFTGRAMQPVYRYGGNTYRDRMIGTIYCNTMVSRDDIYIDTYRMTVTAWARSQHIMDWLMWIGLGSKTVIDYMNLCSPHLTRMLTAKQKIDSWIESIDKKFRCMNLKHKRMIREVVHEDFREGLI